MVSCFYRLPHRYDIYTFTVFTIFKNDQGMVLSVKKRKQREKDTCHTSHFCLQLYHWWKITSGKLLPIKMRKPPKSKDIRFHFFYTLFKIKNIVNVHHTITNYRPLFYTLYYRDFSPKYFLLFLINFNQKMVAKVFFKKKHHQCYLQNRSKTIYQNPKL